MRPQPRRSRRNRDQREVRILGTREPRCDAGERQLERLGIAAARAGGRLEHRPGRGDGLVAGIGLPAHDHQQVRRRDRDVDREIGIPQLVEVRRGRHDARCFRDAFLGAELGAELHQRHRILVQIRKHPEFGRAVIGNGLVLGKIGDRDGRHGPAQDHA